MSDEELVQRGYLASGALEGNPFGGFEELNIGATTIRELQSAGVSVIIPEDVAFDFQAYVPPRSPAMARPDRVFLRRRAGGLAPVAVAEHKASRKLRTEREVQRATEQGLFNAASLGAPIAVTTDGRRYLYVDVEASKTQGTVVFFDERRDLNPAVLANLLAGDAGVAKDPKPLAETVWQTIWHATKEEPKQCLLTFVEILVLKFLSDNLPASALPEAYSFYALMEDPAEFARKHGETAIEYYVGKIRPRVKQLFPDNVVVQDPDIPALFDLSTVVSKTSIINGFAFLKSSEETVAGFNRTFLEVLREFDRFGPLTTIDPEFKLRLYETFLKRSARQQKLGQFFTPRNVVRQMIRMARLGDLPAGAVLLDPAAGVGGSVLEPAIVEGSLVGNCTFVRGRPRRKVKMIGVDVDVNAHILAKANMLIHLAEVVRDPATTVDSLNQLMAETFVLMNSNETLGALENPPRGVVDVVLTNPPYVTKGSAVYTREIAGVEGRRNGVDLRDYYDRCGLGVESLFMRYITGSLKPGGRAFVIVPLGMLNRTDPGPKARLLDECNLLASIALPRNTFFNTSQLTYILALGKRHTGVDPRPPVFCAIARSTGETLDHRRIPTPDDNDLAQIADAFSASEAGNVGSGDASPLIKIIPAEEFGPDDRWDVPRFWTEEELVALGQRESAVPRFQFIDEAQSELEEIVGELESARKELEALTETRMQDVPLSSASVFHVRSGTRVRDVDIRENPGDVPVYSCFKDARIVKGRISSQWLMSNGARIETKTVVTVNANGASIGKVFVRDERCALTDDVVVVEVLRDDIDPEFLAVQLRSAIAEGNFIYEAKLFKGRVRELAVRVPAAGDHFDLHQQRRIASAVKRFETTRQRLSELGEWSGSVRAS